VSRIFVRQIKTFSQKFVRLTSPLRTEKVVMGEESPARGTKILAEIQPHSLTHLEKRFSLFSCQGVGENGDDGAETMTERDA
jgi:hypothetical protein